MKKITMIVIMLLATSISAGAVDQGYFTCLRLDADLAAWFSKAGISSCCALADGMPTRYEERVDGIYVPPFSEQLAQARQCRAGQPWEEPKDPHDHWVRLLDAIILRNKNNPIGVAVIWWTTPESEGEHTVRCFIGTARS